MRDVVWTIIVIWVVWKIYDAFKNVSKTKSQPQGFNEVRKEGEVKIDINNNQKSHFNPKDGEYVDYEEVK